jgi:hypothetical protein
VTVFMRVFRSCGCFPLGSKGEAGMARTGAVAGSSRFDSADDLPHGRQDPHRPSLVSLDR